MTIPREFVVDLDNRFTDIAALMAAVGHILVKRGITTSDELDELTRAFAEEIKNQKAIILSKINQELIEKESSVSNISKGSNVMKFSLSDLISLAIQLGPKFKEAWPHILALVKLFAGDAIPTGVSYSMPATPSQEYQQFFNLATNVHGIPEGEVREVLSLVQSNG